MVNSDSSPLPQQSSSSTRKDFVSSFRLKSLFFHRFPCLSPQAHTHVHSHARTHALAHSRGHTYHILKEMEWVVQGGEQLISIEGTNTPLNPPQVSRLRVNSVKSFCLFVCFRERASHLLWSRGWLWPPCPSAATSPVLTGGHQHACLGGQFFAIFHSASIAFSPWKWPCNLRLWASFIYLFI